MENFTHTNEFEYPSLLQRIQSTVIDWLVILGLMVFFAQIANQIENIPVVVRGIFLGLILLYEPLCITFGCTLGNYLLKIRVRQNENELQKINIFQAVIRYVVKIFLGWISFVTIHANAKKRAIHDIAASSVMIKIN